MNLTGYLRNEGIKDLSRASWDDESKKLSVETVNQYEELGERFFKENTPENIRKFYNFTTRAGLDELFESLWYDRTIKVSPQILSHLKGSQRVLEIGSNSGLKTIYYAMKQPQTHFTSIDLSEASIKIAKKRASKYGCTNIDFQVQNMLDLSSVQPFDAVFAENSLHETQEPIISGRSWHYNPIFHHKFSIISPLIEKGKLIISVNPQNVREIVNEFQSSARYKGFDSSTYKVIPHIHEGKTRKSLLFVAKKQ